MKSTESTSRADLTLANALTRNPALGWGLLALWVIVIGIVGYLWQLGAFGLVDETEPLFSEAARQMLVTGDWITPYFNGVTRFDKPPMIYWLMAIAYRIVGVNEWGARLPSALSAIALLGGIAFVLKRYGVSNPHLAVQRSNGRPPKNPLPNVTSQTWLAALAAVAVTGLTPLMVVWGRTGVSDMLLTAAIGGIMLTFFMGYTTEVILIKRRWYLVTYLCLAIGILTKGPIAFVLPALGIAAFLLYVGQFWTVFWELQLLKGGLIVAILVVPWFVAVTIANGQAYLDSFFGYHNFERMTSVVNRHSAPWYFYFIIVLLGFLPFSVHLPLAIARLKIWKPGLWRQQPRAAHLGPFAFWWFASVFGFFTIAVTKLPSYVIPLMPAAAILVALMWSEQWGGILAGGPAKRSWGRIISGWGNVLFFALLAVACGILPRLLGPDSAAPNLPEAIVEAGLPVVGVALWSTAAVVTVGLLLSGRSRWVGVVNVGAAIGLVMIVVMIGLPLLDSQRQQPIRELSSLAVEQRLSQEEIISLGFMTPTVTFYTQDTVIYTDSRDRLEEILGELAEAGNETVMVLALETEFDDYGLRAPLLDDRLGDAGPFQLVRVNVADAVNALN